MKAKLYVILGAHPSRTAMLMLQHKGIEYETVEIPPGLQPFAMRLLGFKADPGFSRQVDDRRPPMLRAADRLGTVPALRLGERRVMTNRNIARFLDELSPDPPLFPEDPEHRRQLLARKTVSTGRRSSTPSYGATRSSRWSRAAWWWPRQSTLTASCSTTETTGGWDRCSTGGAR